MPGAARISERERRAIAVLSLVWGALLARGLVSPWIGGPAATLLAFSAATAVTVATRRPEPTHSRAAASAAWAAGTALGGAAFALAEASAEGLGWLGGTVPHATALAGTPWVSAVVLAPVFEELLYRERLLPLLRERLGAIGAIVVTSALFAAPHLRGWPLVGAFATGLVLGSVLHRTRSVATCIGLHMGWNLVASFGTR